VDCISDRTWAEINLDHLAHNYSRVVELAAQGNPQQPAKVMSVIKANAYGHGAVQAARILTGAGCEYMAVATIDEAIELRQSGIKARILVLNHIDPLRCEDVLEYDVTQTVYSDDFARNLSRKAVLAKKRARIHIKVDTGMTRIGIDSQEAADTILRIAQMQGLEVEGLFTHFASSDDPQDPFTVLQFNRFMELSDSLKKGGLEIPLKHVCNSAAIIEHPEMHLDMVRPGIVLYGYYPSEEVRKISIKPIMTFKTKVNRVNMVRPDTGISYGRIYRTGKNARIITMPVGYADGYCRLLTGKARVLVNGMSAPVVGKICMDQCMADVTEVSGDIRVGDEVVLWGEQGGKSVFADEIARLIGTISYEVLCNVSRRVPRYYLASNRIIDSINYIRE